MTRTHLLGAASAAAMACLSTLSHAAAPGIFGGGSTLAQFDYIDEQSVFNAGQGTKPTFSTYWEAGSGTGQEAFIYDDLTCDIDKVTGANGGACVGPDGGAGNTVDYGASDATLSSSQISSWATSSFGQAAAGDLIQIPSMGVGIAIPVNNPTVTTNTAATFSDTDLCGIFSGKITNFNQIKDSKNLTAGAITVVYRNDGSGTSFLLTSHLAAVCTNANSNITFTATTTFASLFSTLPGNFLGEKGSSGVANELAGCNGALPDAVGYISPDFTTIDPNSDATIGCTVNGSDKSPLVVAEVINATAKKAYQPTVTNIAAGLVHPKAGTGQNLTPPTNATDGANPALWVPVEPIVTSGYPIVGYTTFDLAQCYAKTNVGGAIVNFLNDHFSNATYTSYQVNNGFVSLKASAASQFLTAIKADLLKNTNNWNDNIDNTTACAGLKGR